MTIITPFPDPMPTMADPTNFPEDAESAWDHLANTVVPEIEVLGASLAAAAAPGGVAVAYLFSTTTAAADPGPGKLRLNNATQTSATAVYADLLDVSGVDWTTVLGHLADSTNGVKGQLTLRKAGDATKWLVFNVTALASPSGYRNITVTSVGGSSATPFANLDPIVMTFTQAGDYGTGVQWAHFRQEQASGVAPNDTAVATTYVKRTLNTTSVNNITGCSLATSQITLAAGTYAVWAWGMVGNSDLAGSQGRGRLRLRNATDGADLLIGPAVRITTNASNPAAYMAPLAGVFTLGGTKAVELDGYTSGVANFGSAASSGDVEVYNEIFLLKVA